MRSHRLLIVLMFLFGGIVVILHFKPMYYTGCDYYSGFLGSAFATFFAAFLVWVAWEELSKLSRTTSADFIHKLNNDFFTRETRTLVSLIECEALEFIEPPCSCSTGNDTESNDDCIAHPYFTVNSDIIEKTELPDEPKRRLCRRMFYTGWDVDDILLGHFENIGMLEQRGIVDFQMVYDVFSWYLETAWDNEHIKNYIRNERKGSEDDPIDTLIYSKFQYIVVKCTEYDGFKNWYSKWWWEIRRSFCGPHIAVKI